jgi:hypothetical protein
MSDTVTSPVSRDLADEAQRIVADLEAALGALTDQPVGGR